MDREPGGQRVDRVRQRTPWQMVFRETRAGEAYGPRFGVHLTAAGAAAAAIAALRLTRRLTRPEGRGLC